MPLISVAIYCSLAARLGIKAQPVEYPFHVYAIVHPPSSVTLDGKTPTPSATPPEPMYLDIFRSHSEVPLETLKKQLSLMGVASWDYARHISPAPVLAITARQGRNMLYAADRLPGMLRSSLSRESIDRDSALYATIWALLSTHTALHTDLIPYMLDKFSEQYAEDVSHFEQHILPLLEDHADFLEWQLRTTTIRIDSQKPKTSKRRHGAAGRTPKFRVGQAFRHKRYDYTAVITGWDNECQADDGWVARMGVDRLPRGRAQAFCHALVEDRSMRYVAEDNIEVLDDWTPQGELMDIAGRYFKRWDDEKREFVSNIREEYPDD